MRESYFSSETIDERSWQMLQKLRKYREQHKITFIPEHSALLILDMQRYFLDGSSHAYVPSSLPIIPRIKDLSNAFLKANLPVILTRHLNNHRDAKLMREWWKDLIMEENVLSEIIPEFSLPRAIVIKKTQYDAFYNTPLENLLKEKGVTQVVITGVMTHLCCETTARSAFVRGYRVFFPIDGTATYSQEFHWAAFLNLSHGFSIPILIKELQKCLEAS
ncbi:MAG: isochorismatase family protein [Acidobacteriota bacterium]